MLDRYIDWYRLFSAAGSLISSLYLLGLWWVALRRSGLRFFWLLIASNAFFVIASVIFVVMVLAEDYTRYEVFGERPYADFIHVFDVAQPLVTILNLIAYTLIVKWILRAQNAGPGATQKV